MHLLMVFYLDRMCQCGLLAVLWSRIGTLMRRLAAEPRSIEVLLFPSQCASGTIFLTDGFDGVGPSGFKNRACFLIGLSCSIPNIVFYYVSLSFLSVYRLVLWGRGLRTEDLRVAESISLSALLCRPFSIIIRIICCE